MKPERHQWVIKRQLVTVANEKLSAPATATRTWYRCQKCGDLKLKGPQPPCTRGRALPAPVVNRGFMEPATGVTRE